MISTSDPTAGFWGFHQDEGAVPWQDPCPLTSSTRTTMACSRWSSTWACLWESTSESFFNPDVSSRLLYPHWSAAVVLWIASSLSDEMLHYWLIGWLQSQACKFSLHQQNSPFGGGSNLASSHSDQSGTLTVPHIGWLSAQNDWVNLCSIITNEVMWCNILRFSSVFYYFQSYFYPSGSWSHGNKSKKSTPQRASTVTLGIKGKEKWERITFCFHLILCLKEQDGDALITQHNKSPSFYCIINYSKWGPCREVDLFRVQGQQIDGLGSATLFSDTPIL